MGLREENQANTGENCGIKKCGRVCAATTGINLSRAHEEPGTVAMTYLFNSAVMCTRLPVKAWVMV